MSIILKNQLGSTGGTDLQRRDLWQIDVSVVSSFLTTLDASFFTNLGIDRTSVTGKNFLISAISVAIPPRKIKPKQIIRGSVPQNFPAGFEALDVARIEVLHEAFNTKDRVSPSYALFEAWRTLGRAGRDQNFLLDSTTFRPTFRFDIPIRFYSGSSDGTGFDESASYQLSGCWVRGLQFGQIDKTAEASNHSFTVQLQAVDINEA